MSAGVPPPPVVPIGPWGVEGGGVKNSKKLGGGCSLIKVFESFIRDIVVEHLEVNGLVTGTQHGFRKGGCCLSNLLQFVDQVT